jgi:cobalt-zinc-cadmium efflux system outer membrane protein
LRARQYLAAAVLAVAPALALAQSPPLASLAPARSLTLREAESLAAERNREVVAARRAIDQARADTIAAGAPPNPVLTLGTGMINPQQGLGRAAIPGGARIEQLLERGNKRELRIETARRLEDAFGASLDDTLRQQRLAVASAYYDLKLAQDRVAIARELAELTARTLGATEIRLKAGDVAASDVARIRVDTLRAENDARAALAAVTDAQVVLAYLVAIDADTTALRAVDEWPPVEDEFAEATEVAIARRPDVRSARARMEAAKVQRDLARALRTRDVTVGAGVDRYPPADTNTLGVGTSVGVSVSVPLFLRYNFEGEIARAEANLLAAEEDLTRIEAAARADAARAIAALRSAADRRRRYEGTLLTEARRAADFAELAYQKGASGVLDLLDARRTLRAVQVSGAETRTEYAKALSAWRATVGDLLR